MPRYSICLSYNGTNYSGWQIQDNARSIQGEIEKILHKVTGQDIGIVGCGRTDAGVHAKRYIAHFDQDHNQDLDLEYKLNRMLDADVVVHSIDAIGPTFHARFDAISRSYSYLMSSQKDPFNPNGYYHCPYIDKLDIGMLNEAAGLLTQYTHFFPFCKAHSDSLTMECAVKASFWTQGDEDALTYHVTANRFLRGMVRMIVGMCINVALEKITLQNVIDAMDSQSRLGRPWSVPASGLYLTDVIYPT